MALLIDTSVVVELERLLSERKSDALHLAPITASQLLHGVRRADTALRRGRREAFVEAILAALPILPFDLAVARIWSDLRRRGELTGAHNLIIAGTAIHHGLRIATRNSRGFRRIPEVVLVEWP